MTKENDFQEVKNLEFHFILVIGILRESFI